MLTTPLTKAFGIQHPIILAGMNVAAGPELAAAVTNAGGLGVIGGVFYTPDFLKKQIAKLKSFLHDKNAPFGVDLLLPQVGGNARKTNTDYTDGQLPQLIDIIIEAKARLFVCAVGVPPEWAVEKLHANGILVMNMVGAPRHAQKALKVGVDLICAQGGEGGGHTGDIPTSLLIPAVVDLVKGHTSRMTGEPIYVVAAGGIYDGRGLAMALAFGAQAVWVGTRFVCAKEASAPPRHQEAILKAGYTDTIRTVIFTGRPMRVLKTDYISDWELYRQKEIKELTSQGVIPALHDFDQKPPAFAAAQRPLLMGQVAGAINDIKPAKEIIDEMVAGAVHALQTAAAAITAPKAKL